MLKLMIECSRTGHLIPTGIETDARSFAMLPNVTTETFCAYCRRHHRWSKDDVCFDQFTAEPIAH
jgi:hypothetical protein